MKNTILFYLLIAATIALFALKPGEPETHSYYCSYFYDGANTSAVVIQVDGIVQSGKDVDVLTSIIKQRHPGSEKVVIINIQHLPIR